MNLGSVGDASQFLRLRTDSNLLKSQIGQLTHELSTGIRTDIGAASGGSFATLADVTRSLALNRSFSDAIAVATMEADARQTALGQVEGQLSAAAPQLLSLSAAGSLQSLETANADAAERFSHSVNALNVSIGGRSLFAGDTPDRAPLIDAAEMLVHLEPIAAAAVTAEDLIQDVKAWFEDAGGGFETLAWQGGGGSGSPAVLGEGYQEDIGLTALDPALREAFTGLALAALADAGVGPPDETSVRTIIRSAAEHMLTGETAIITLRAELGAAQGRIEETRVQTEATRSTLEIERTRLLEADPYRTATDLEAAQTRLESLYILTARLSRLSLSEYLR